MPTNPNTQNDRQGSGAVSGDVFDPRTVGYKAAAGSLFLQLARAVTDPFGAFLKQSNTDNFDWKRLVTEDEIVVNADCVFQVSDQGPFTEIQAAIDDAVSKGFGPAKQAVVIVQCSESEYVEDLTLTEGIHLIGVGDNFSQIVSVRGMHTINQTTLNSITLVKGINFICDGGIGFDVNGSVGARIDFINCNFQAATGNSSECLRVNNPNFRIDIQTTNFTNTNALGKCLVIDAAVFFGNGMRISGDCTFIGQGNCIEVNAPASVAVQNCRLISITAPELIALNSGLIGFTIEGGSLVSFAGSGIRFGVTGIAVTLVSVLVNIIGSTPVRVVQGVGSNTVRHANCTFLSNNEFDTPAVSQVVLTSTMVGT